MAALHLFNIRVVQHCASILATAELLFYTLGEVKFRCTDAYKPFKTPYSTNTRRCEHITPVLQQLHWLPVRQRIQFNIAVLVCKTMHDLLPAYLAEDCQVVSVTGHQ